MHCQTCILVNANETLFQVYLGDYPDKHFTEPKAQEAIERFQSHLREVSAVIHKRNKSLKVPYEYLLPENIPNSTSL